VDRVEPKRHMCKISVGIITIDVVRRDIKNLHLYIDPPDGRAWISAPKWLDEKEVRSFALSKLPWIKRHQERFKKLKLRPNREYVSGESHYFLGKPYKLNVIYQPPTSYNKVRIRDDRFLDLYVRKGSDREQRKRALTEWYRKQLKDIVPYFIEKWEERIGVEASDWGIRRMKTKWGSCNVTAKRIWLNLELAKKPPLCLEYILAHELVHLLEPSHNRRFKAYMDRFMSNWRLLEKELNRLPPEHGDWSC